MLMQNDAVIGCRLSKSISFSQDEELYIATSDTKTKMQEDYAPFVRKVLNIAEFIPSSVLDLGCGPGYIARRLRDVLPEAFIVGIDKSEIMVSHAVMAAGIYMRNRAGVRQKQEEAVCTGNIAGVGYKDNFLPASSDTYLPADNKKPPSAGRLDYLVADSASLPFGDSTFDLIILKGTFKCLDEKLASLKEICRVLRRGGEAFIYEFRKEIGEEEFGMLTARMNPQKVKSLKRKLNCSLDAADYEKYLLDAGLRGFFEIENDGIDLRIRIFKHF